MTGKLHVSDTARPKAPQTTEERIDKLAAFVAGAFADLERRIRKLEQDHQPDTRG